MKLHARLELTVANIKMSTPTLVKMAEELRRELETVKSDERFYKRETIKLSQVIDSLTLDFLKQDDVEKLEADSLREQITVNRKMAQDLEEESLKCALLARDVEQIKVEKEQKVF